MGRSRSVRGVPQKAIPLAQIAMRALLDPASLPPGTDDRLEAEPRFTGERLTGSGWSGGTHLCIVEVDLGTGRVRILRYLVVEDCGRVINPAVVEGQVRGGVAQGIGEVLYEHAASHPRAEAENSGKSEGGGVSPLHNDLLAPVLGFGIDAGGNDLGGFIRALLADSIERRCGGEDDPLVWGEVTGDSLRCRHVYGFG